MGCDIHVYLEERKVVNSVSMWCNIDKWEINPYYDKNNGSTEYNHVSCFLDRDYDLFATLADVRNYGLIKPMCQPRGLPKDANIYTLQESLSWGEDGHSHSWFTMKELLKYPETSYKQCGYISPESAEALPDKLPDEWCGGTSDETWVFREWTRNDNVLERLIKSIKDVMIDSLYLKWSSTEEQEAKILKFADRFRIIFWFDN